MISNTKEFSVTVDGSAFVTESTLLEFLAEKQDKFTGRPGQIVGFDEAGNPVAQEAPDTGVFSFNGRTGAVVPEKGDYTAADVGARPDSWTPTAADVGAVPTTRTVNGKALSADISLTATDVGALPSGGTAAAATKLATARTISLTGDVTGSTTFDGTANKSIAATLAASGVTAGTYGSDLFSDSSNSWLANNKGIHSTTAQTVFTLKKAGTVTFTYNLNSENTHDKFTVTVATGGSSTNIVSAVSGTNKTETITTEELAIGDTITFKYVKDSSINTGQDTVLITALKFTATGSTSTTTLTQKTLTTYFTVSNSQYYFAPVSNTGPVVPIPRFTVDAKGRITRAENMYLPLTCANIGALPLSGGTMTGALTMTDAILVNRSSKYALLAGTAAESVENICWRVTKHDGTRPGLYWVGLTNDTSQNRCRIAGIATPVYNSDATPKDYVDSAISGLSGTYLPLSGGTLTGNLTLKGSSNYGTKINLGDGDYVHISEPTDDCMEIKAKKINFVVSASTADKFTLNGAPIGASFDGTELMNYNPGTISDGSTKTNSVTILTNKKYLISLVARVGNYYTSNVLYLNSNERLDSAFYFMNNSGIYKGAVTIVKEPSSRNLSVDLINKTGSSASNCSVSIIVLMELS